MVMAQSLFKAVKAEFPDVQIDVLAPSWTLSLLERMPEVRSGIEMPLGHGALGWSVRKQLGESLRGAYDQAIVLPNSWKSALVPWFAKIPVRTGFVGEVRYGLLNDARRLDKQRLPKTIERFVALAQPHHAKQSIEISRPRLAAQDPALVLSKQGLAKPSQILALCPGAEYGPAKQWPAEHFAALSEQWLGAQADAEVWIFGSEKDRLFGDAILGRLGAAMKLRARNLAGKTELGEAIDLMSLADVVVSNDSGLMHVAAALDRPLVAIFGSSDPAHTPPNGDLKKTKSIWLGLECSPCFKRECPLGHLDCLKKIFPEDVFQAVEAVS
jgi:heptosyltransferase-2